jgi:accessory colonization factor AcfC
MTVAMARRPNLEKERMLNDEDLTQLRENLAHLSESAVKDFYNHAHRDCAIIGPHFPTAISIQQLVTAWKQLRKWRKQ